MLLIGAGLWDLAVNATRSSARSAADPGPSGHAPSGTCTDAPVPRGNEPTAVVPLSQGRPRSPGGIIGHMIQSIGRRLLVAFGRRDAEGVVTAEAPAASAPLPEVEFVAYGEDCLLSGRVRLAAERLTDMLNEHDEFLLADVMVERLDGQPAIEVKEVLVPRDELLLVHATGPRGSQGRRQRTRQHPIGLQMGPYHVRGYLHALPGSDPIASFRRRKTMVPLTDAWIEYGIGSARQRRRVGTLVVNREQVDWVVPAQDDEVEMPDLPLKVDQGPLLKDFTGAILTESMEPSRA